MRPGLVRLQKSSGNAVAELKEWTFDREKENSGYNVLMHRKRLTMDRFLLPEL
jgi:hypothetical protein